MHPGRQSLTEPHRAIAGLLTECGGMRYARALGSCYPAPIGLGHDQVTVTRITPNQLDGGRSLGAYLWGTTERRTARPAGTREISLRECTKLANYIARRNA
jgi:hypothetical protein